MNANQRQLRQQILSSAWKRFAVDGFAGSSMADIALDCRLEVREVFAQFPRKEDLVFELYFLLALQLEECVVELPEGTLTARFGAAMDAKIAILDKHKPVLHALFETMTDAGEDLGVMSAHMELIRRRVRGVFASVAWGAADRPADEKMPELVRHLYRLHLGLVFLWFRNPPAYRAARGTLGPLLRLSQPALEMAPLHKVLARVDQLLHEKVEPHDEERALAEQILLRLFRHRRLQGGHDATCAEKPCPQCLALHIGRVEAFIQRGEPIQMVLPAFPAKSPNRSKVLGDLPDMAEELALRSLDNLCREISEIYPAGAKLIICSDGHVFSDLVGVPDKHVDGYNTAIRRQIVDKELDSLSFFNLADIFQNPDYDHIRGELLEPYCESLDVLRDRVKRHAVHRHLFDGLHRFLFEDQLVLQPELSRNRVRENCKDLTYRVMQRSNAWGRLVGTQFPDALRLSIHPQAPHSEKIGILLSPAVDSWITPWHGVALLRDSDFLLMKREQAEKLGAEVVYEDGRPIHFAVFG